MSAAQPPLAAPRGRRADRARSDLGRLLRLTWTLAVTDFKLRFFGSVLGYLWQLMRPLMLFGVLYLVFSFVLDVGGDVPYYPVALLLGLVLFTFFAEATGGSVRSIVAAREPRPQDRVPAPGRARCRRADVGVQPRCSTSSPVADLPARVGRDVQAAPGSSSRCSWPLLIGFAIGLAMLLVALFVRYRDIEPIWDVVLQVLFYATPIFYTIADRGREGGREVWRTC